ncbi:hypothetical protein, partial [Bradyrhizobium sp. JR18.2]|uniref:LexA family protein n=1 Tax=Bradyrhizobium sp. JR18.2 TaxID=3156369 RepID=UPI0033967F1B
RLAAQILLRHLPFELDAVGSVLCHGPSSSESPAVRSITESQPVPPGGPTPIHLYTRLHRTPPAETDMQEYFRVSPPSVHQMVLTLERAGLIRRQPRTPRSIEVLVDPKLLPELI